MNSKINPYALILSVGLLLFIPFLGSVHLFDWDEINFAESAREMMVSGNYSQVTINYQGFWEKPPLFIWIQTLSMHVFGVNEMAARLPNALFGIFTFLYLFHFSKKELKSPQLGLWWVFCYLASITPQLYFKTGLIDPMFNGFILLSIFEIYKYFRQSIPSVKPLLFAGLFSGIAILLKGPVALLISGLVVLCLLFDQSYRSRLKFGHLLLYGLSTLLIASIWFLPETLQNGPYFIVQFINYQIGLFSQNIAGHQQPFYYHALVLLFGCFPISIIAIAFWPKSKLEIKGQNHIESSAPITSMRLFMLILFWVVLILFSIVKTKIVHYSSLCWIPLTFLAADGITRHNAILPKWSKWPIAFIGGLLGCILIILPISLMHFKTNLIALVNDPFAKANIMANVHWSNWDILPGLIILINTFLWCMHSEQRLKQFTLKVYLGLQVLFISLTASIITPKIEAHTQGAVIDFYQAKANDDCYWFVTGYKSYAAYFYAKIQPLKTTDGLQKITQAFIQSKQASNYLALSEADKNALDDAQKDWLLHGPSDKPVYFVAKSHDQEGLEKETQLIKIWEANGFIAYKRP
jgi:4-amino-4-deoxy-L-arabinose transferase-like glycosyltransferase